MVSHHAPLDLEELGSSKFDDNCCSSKANTAGYLNKTCLFKRVQISCPLFVPGDSRTRYSFIPLWSYHKLPQASGLQDRSSAHFSQGQMETQFVDCRLAGVSDGVLRTSACSPPFLGQRERRIPGSWKWIATSLRCPRIPDDERCSEKTLGMKLWIVHATQDRIYQY